jgi:DNA-binding Lrp family transcriptional regulator
MEKNVLKNLKSGEGVQEAFPVRGAYDIIARVKADTFSSLKEKIARIKRNLPKLQNMETMLIVEPWLQPQHENE